MTVQTVRIDGRWYVEIEVGGVVLRTVELRGAPHAKMVLDAILAQEPKNADVHV